MEIKIYDEYGEYREIQKIEYTQYNGKDTIIDYLKENDGEIYTIRFEGWLTIQEIINEIENLWGDKDE